MVSRGDHPAGSALFPDPLSPPASSTRSDWREYRQALAPGAPPAEQRFTSQKDNRVRAIYAPHTRHTSSQGPLQSPPLRLQPHLSSAPLLALVATSLSSSYSPTTPSSLRFITLTTSSRTNTYRSLTWRPVRPVRPVRPMRPQGTLAELEGSDGCPHARGSELAVFNTAGANSIGSAL